MNLELFNRMNIRDNNTNYIEGMYSEWTSSSSLMINYHTNLKNQSVLEKFDLNISKDITIGLVKQLASNLGISQSPEPSHLTSDEEVQWCMQVTRFGLSLPLTEHEAIKDCVNIYCEWLSALLPNPKVSVPQPIIDEPNIYSRKIIAHLHNLFIPRNDEGVDLINRQAVLCHRVLRTLQQIAYESKLLKCETWEALLLFLLAINDTLLSPPTVKDDVADHLCERVQSVLFEIWLIACVQCFPSPSLWKTLRECCMNWRHRVALIEQWNRVNLILTSKLLNFLYGPEFPHLKKFGENDLIMHEMNNDCIAQSWYRFLNTIGNPICLTKPNIISQTQKFLQYAINSNNITDPSQHPCLQSLPVIFLKAIKGIAGQVDAFLGIAQLFWWETLVLNCNNDKGKDSTQTSVSHSPTPPSQRRLAKSFSVAQSSVSKGIPKASLINSLTTSRSSAIVSTTTIITPTTITATIATTTTTTTASSSSSSSITSNSSATTTSTFTTASSSNAIGNELNNLLAPDRPKCNSILHLFGEWLFDAAFINCDLIQKNLNDSKKRPNSVIMDTKNSLNYSTVSSSSQSSATSTSSSATSTSSSNNFCTNDKFESGRAEALGVLCRIMCAKKAGEEILPIYLARFYLAIQQGLKIPDNNKNNFETLTAILLNSSDLFRLDLDGVRILVPSFISALEIILPDKDLKLIPPNVNKIELRRASIHILSSLLVLPLHFHNVIIKELHNNTNSGTGGLEKYLTFSQLKQRLINLVMNALQIEWDPQNTHMLLGCLFFCVQDTTLFEKIEQVIQPTPLDSTSSSNLLSSASDTASTISMASSCERSTSPDYLTGSSCDSFLSSLDSAHALFVRATYLVCHRLISSWKSDLNVSLAALELLSGLARLHIKESDAIECKRAVKWLCDYIFYQCSRPPPAHSKDLHSTIVAAFQCCSIWLLEHPQLLKDKDCLTNVLEVAELGISGTKSVGKPGEEIKLKQDKELKPASMRVRDAAENLLTCILEQVGYFPNECGPESISSLLDEVSLLQYCNSWPNNCTKKLKAIERFRYFMIEGSIMLALLEEPLGNDQDPQPTITILIRGPFGRHVWTMQLRHLPRHKSGTKHHNYNPGRPVLMQDVPLRVQVKQKYFPDNIDQFSTQCKVDQSIPTFESILNNNKILKEEINLLSQLIDKQTISESHLLHTKTNEFLEECTPPSVCHDFQTARLFLTHFGLLSLDDDKNNTNLFAIDNLSMDFCKDLGDLDNLSPRTCDTIHVFYVKSHQKKADDILNNVKNLNLLSPYFVEFIHTLGWSVDINNHPGWTGHSTNWKLKNKNDELNQKTLYDGTKNILYWADAFAEIAFIIPSNDETIVFNANSYTYDRDKRTMSLTDIENKPVAPKRSGQRSTTNTYTNAKIMVVWLESYEDHLNFPVENLLNYMDTGLEKNPTKNNEVFIIYLHLMATGLFRVHLQGPSGRMNFALPLIDGLIVSRRTLGPLVRQTALNMVRRKRLDSDSYQPPHVKRRLKLQEILQKYKKEMTKPELLTYLFQTT